MAFLLRAPEKMVREDGTSITVVKSRGFVGEFKANLEIFKDWKLLLMVSSSILYRLLVF